MGSNHILLTSWFGKKFQIKRAGFRLAGALPTSQAIVTHNLPLHCTSDGVYVVSNQESIRGGILNAKDFDFIKYDELACVDVEGKNIRLNKIHTIKTPAPASAKYQTEFIKELKDSSRSARKNIINDRLQDSFDLKSIEEIQTSHLRAFSIIKFLSSYLFLVVFLILPIVLYTDLSKYANLDIVLICIAMSYIMLLAATFITVKRSYKSDKDAKVCTLLAVIFSPVNVLHIMAYLTKNLYFRFNYLALAAYFLPGKSFKGIVRKELLLMEHFLNEIDRQDWWVLWTFKKELTYSLLEARSIDPDEISATPVKQDLSALSYCPYCLTEYSKKRPSCVDCNMALKEFDAGQQPSDLRSH